MSHRSRSKSKASDDRNLPFSGSIAMTAVLVNQSRAQRIDLSNDVYSLDWVKRSQRAALSRLWSEYSEYVYPHDDMVLSIRNRFFCDLIDKACSSKDICVIAPCGLTSYPYITSSNCEFHELDMAGIITYKQKRAKWIEESLDPPKLKTIIRKPIDLGVETALLSYIQALPKRGKKLVILEGISYYVESERWWQLLAELRSGLRSGDMIAFDFWPAADASKSIYGRYLDFCHRHRAYLADSFTYISEVELQKFSRGTQLHRQSVVNCEYSILGTFDLRGKSILNDTYAILILD